LCGFGEEMAKETSDGSGFFVVKKHTKFSPFENRFGEV